MIEYRLADYSDEHDAAALIRLLDTYAIDPMGGGEPLGEKTRQHLAASLAVVPGAFSMFGLSEGTPIALANCFTGFSTFACQPLINIHDLMVDPSMQGQGVAAGLLEAVEQEAKARGSCKVTLEVLEGNHAARRAYERAGFKPYSMESAPGDALFLHRHL